MKSGFKIKLKFKGIKVLANEGNIQPKPKQGIYTQIQPGNIIKYDPKSFSLNNLKEIIGDLYIKQPVQERKVKIITTQAGMDLFNKAMQEQALKQIKKNEHRKKFSFRSKILKQTYKFRQ